MALKACRFFALIMMILVVAGCATARSRKPDTHTTPNQVAQLQHEIREMDEQIADLEQELNDQRMRRSRSHEREGKSVMSKGSVIRVPGVKPTQLQKALKKVGYDPGLVDGRIGPRTIEAIRRFQKRHGLTPDGVVGKKTWTLLKNEAG